jgi:plasmid stabilization system protein ParE
MATVELARIAERDLDELIASHQLPAGTRERVARSLLTLKQFPRAGKALTGAWRGYRALVGPWGWLIAVYAYEDAHDRITVLAFHDARAGGVGDEPRSRSRG